MLEAAHIFVTQKPGCDKWYSWSIARRLCSSSIPLESWYHWIQPDHQDLGPWAATSLGCPDLTPCRIPFTELPFGVHYAVRFHGGASKKVLQEGYMVGRADVRWGSVHWVAHCLLWPPTGEINVSWTTEMLLFHRKYKPYNCWYFLSCLGYWGAQSQICSWNSLNIKQFNSMHFCVLTLLLFFYSSYCNFLIYFNSIVLFMFL